MSKEDKLYTTIELSRLLSNLNLIGGYNKLRFIVITRDAPINFLRFNGLYKYWDGAC